MSLRDRLVNSMKTSPNLWICVWALFLLNLLMVYILIRGMSWAAGIIFAVLLLAGALAVLFIANYKPPEPELDEDIQARLEKLMEEIRPYCEEVFDIQVKKALRPIEFEYREKFSQGLAWLWEKVDDFYAQVEQVTQDGRTIFQLVNPAQEEKAKLVESLQEGAQQVLKIIQDLQRRRFYDQDDISSRIQAKITDFRNSLLKERQYYYESVYKILWEQARSQGRETEMADYLSPVKLGQQFSIIVEKNLASRVADFNNSLTEDLENFSADIVGRFQKSTVHVLNHLRNMKSLLEKLIDLSTHESRMLLKRLDEYLQQVSQLEERAGEMLVSLAWQDIMVEKRWGEIQERLFSIKDKVMENTEEGVLESIEGVVEEAIPGLSAVPRDTSHAVFYKALLEAELIYQTYINQKMPEVLDDGVYSLLQFIRPLEILAANSIRISDEGLNRLRKRKNLNKEVGIQSLFDQVRMSVEFHYPQVANILEGVFPRRFQQFASNPYLKNKPDNLDQAAWMIFNAALDRQNLTEDGCLLVGLLLVISQIRDKHIDPFNNIPLGMEDKEEVHIVREIVYRAISILVQKDLSEFTSNRSRQVLVNQP